MKYIINFHIILMFPLYNIYRFHNLYNLYIISKYYIYHPVLNSIYKQGDTMIKKQFPMNVRPIKRFTVAVIAHLTRDGKLTNAEAYRIYVEGLSRRAWNYHADKYVYCNYEYQTEADITNNLDQILFEDQWIRMNVRNQLCRMVADGLIKRIAPGHYGT